MVLKRLQEVDMLLELSPCLSSIVVTPPHSRWLMNTRYTATNVDMQLASHPEDSRVAWVEANMQYTCEVKTQNTCIYSTQVCFVK